MLNYSEDLKKLFLENSISERRLEIRVNDGRVLTAENIVSETLTITENLSSGADLILGSCEAAEFRVTCMDVDTDLTDAEIEVYMYIGYPEDFDLLYPQDTIFPALNLYPIEDHRHYVPLGKYIVSSFKHQNDRRFRDLVAYDCMTKFDVDISAWYNSLKFPMTLRDLRSKLMEHIGIVENADVDYLANDGIEILKNAEMTEMSGRDFLQCIEEVNGVFGHIDRTGVFQHVYLSPTPSGVPYPSDRTYPAATLYPSGGNHMEPTDLTKITASEYYTFRWEEYTVKGIDRLDIMMEDGESGISYGDGSNCYKIENNLILFDFTASQLEEIANNIAGLVFNRTYTPIIDFSGVGMPWVEVGDSIQVTTSDATVTSYVLSRTLSGIQALKDEYTADGSLERSYDSSMTRQMKVFMNRTRATFAVLDDAIEAEVKRATDFEAKLKIQADQIETTVTDFKREATSQIKQNAEQISLKVSIGDVSNQLSVETGQIKISGNRLVIDTSNFKLSANGTIKCTNGEFSGKIDAGEGRIGGFSIQSDGSIKTASNASIDFGDIAYIDRNSANIADWDFDDNGNLQGPLLTSGSHAQYWDSGGNLHATEIYIHDGWWKGWSVTETVEQLWNYVYNGGWNPCKEDCKVDTCNCDAGVCLCDAASGTTGDSPCARDDSCGSDRGCDDSPGCSKDGCGGDYPCHGDCSCHGPGDA